MTRNLVAATLLALSGLGVARAADRSRPIAPDKLSGRFTFERSRGSTCRVVSDAIVAAWNKGYSCLPSEGLNGISGRPVTARCTSQDQRKEFLVFASMDDCQAERKSLAGSP